MRKWQRWMIWLIPTINIIFMNGAEYAEAAYSSDSGYNWWGQFLPLFVGLVFYVLHYILAFLTPVLLYKRQKAFSFRSCLFAVTAVLAANAIMLMFELAQAGPDRFPQYMIAPVCITMGAVIIVSALLMAKQRRGKESGVKQAR